MSKSLLERIAKLKEKLNAMEKVKDFKIKDGETDGLTRFEVISTGEEDLNEELFRLVAENGWSLAELYQESLSLEDVFQQLTLKEN